jgi:hypothetical protein
MSNTDAGEAAAVSSAASRTSRSSRLRAAYGSPPGVRMVVPDPAVRGLGGAQHVRVHPRDQGQVRPDQLETRQPLQTAPPPGLNSTPQAGDPAPSMYPREGPVQRHNRGRPGQFEAAPTRRQAAM